MEKSDLVYFLVSRQNRIPTLLPQKECPVRLSPESRERSMTALRNKLGLSNGESPLEKIANNLVGYCVGITCSMTDELGPCSLFSQVGLFVPFLGDKGWICDTGWHFHSTVSQLLGHPHA